MCLVISLTKYPMRTSGLAALTLSSIYFVVLTNMQGVERLNLLVIMVLRFSRVTYDLTCVGNFLT